MKGTGQERMTLERLVEAKINSFAHPREFFLRKIGSSVGGKTSWGGDGRGRKTQEKVINRALNADSGSWDVKQMFSVRLSQGSRY